jgi:hypothetical protein
MADYEVSGIRNGIPRPKSARYTGRLGGLRNKNYKCSAEIVFNIQIISYKSQAPLRHQKNTDYYKQDCLRLLEL